MQLDPNPNIGSEQQRSEAVAQHVIGSIIGSIIQLLNPAPDTIVGAQVPHGMQDNGNAHGQQVIEDIQPIGDAQHNPIVDTAPIPIPRGGQTGVKHIEDGHPTAPDETAGIAVPATPEPAYEQAEQSGRMLPQYAETIAQPANNELKLPPTEYNNVPQIRVPYQPTPTASIPQRPAPIAPIEQGIASMQAGQAIGGQTAQHGARATQGIHAILAVNPSTTQQSGMVQGVVHIPIGTIHAQLAQARGGQQSSLHAPIQCMGIITVSIHMQGIIETHGIY
jgi:hypothetical protein